jgi:uncharacterized integral membrane protein (TIGR00698 family)
MHKKNEIDSRQADASKAVLPGLLLCALVTGVAYWVQGLEERWLGRAWLEALVIAIVLGTAIRTAWAPGPRWRAGIRFGAKYVLEVAVVLLGATVSGSTILNAGHHLLFGIVAVVFVAIGVSYGLGRLFGLPPKMAMLIACGNSICGNSAIAAVAPVIGARSDDVAASIAFTAVLGVAVVLGLPPLAMALGMTSKTFGILAGLTVYAVPQVLAATAPVGLVSVQLGTLVKLVRVLMLGPVVLALSLLMRSRRRANSMSAQIPDQHLPRRSALATVMQLVPWFIIGFLGMVALRSADLLPQAWLAPVTTLSGWLTVVSMAALGLGVDVRVVAKAGPRVSAVVMLSLLALGTVSCGLIALLS